MSDNDETNMINPFAKIELLEKEIARLKRYETLVRFIANDYVELSHDKVQNEYLHIIKSCRKLVEEDAANLILGLAIPVYYNPEDDF